MTWPWVTGDERGRARRLPFGLVGKETAAPWKIERQDDPLPLNSYLRKITLKHTFSCKNYQGPLGGGVSNGGVSRSGLVLPFLSFLGLSRFFRDFPSLYGDSSGISRFVPLRLSRPVNSTYEEQSREGPTQSRPFPKKVGNPPVWKPPGLASLKIRISTRNSLKKSSFLRAARVQNETAPEKLLDRYELECRKWGFKRWGFKEIRGYLRKKAFFLRFLDFSGCCSGPLENFEKGRKRAKQADFQDGRPDTP